MDRQSIYAEIDRERDYQDMCAKACEWSPQTAEGKPVECTLVYIEGYLEQAKKAILPANRIGKPQALHALRKIAALCVKCFELHGVPMRDMQDAMQREDYARKDELPPF